MCTVVRVGNELSCDASLTNCALHIVLYHSHNASSQALPRPLPGQLHIPPASSKALSAMIYPFIFIPLLSSLSLSLPLSTPCTPHPRPIILPLRIHLLFTGPSPLFMRPTFPPAAQSDFLSQLSVILRHPAPSPPKDTSPLTPHISVQPQSNLCSVVEYNQSYSLSYAQPSFITTLDRIVSEELEKSGSMFANGPTVADRFVDAVQTFIPKQLDVYTLLIYHAAAVSPQRGYVAEKGGMANTAAMATKARFAFLDVGAKPYFLDQGGLTPGEMLTASSNDVLAYASKLREFASAMFAPVVSLGMRRFPLETRIVFELREVDVSAVIGRIEGVAGDSTDEVEMGRTFERDKFEAVVSGLFADGVFGGKNVETEVVKVDVGKDADVGMAVARSFSMRGLEMVMDAKGLLRDVVGDRAGYFVDRSFVAHVPMYLFSIADDSRITHFETGEGVRAKVVGQEAVFMVENRLKDRADDVHASVTTEAVKEVLELLCGLGRESSGYMDAGRGIVPIVLKDIMKRNIVTQELDWSEGVAARKAVELINFEGLDRRLIPHEKGSAIAESRTAVSIGLQSLYDSWERAAAKGSVQQVEDATFELIRKSKHLTNKLHDEICNQPLPEEIMLKAEAEVDKEQIARVAVSSVWFYLTSVYFPFAAGVICGCLFQLQRRRRKKARGNALGEIPVVSPTRPSEPSANVLWFSTLTSSDKPKVS